MKILLVEDEVSVREMYANILKRKGHEIAETGTGKEAIEMIEKTRPDMVYLDISLADEVTGIDVLRKCKPKFPEVEFVMMSAYQAEHGQEAEKLGASGFIKKPVFKIEAFLGPLEAIKAKKGF